MSNRIWLTSDTHFGHANAIKYCNRPFEDVYDMDQEIIKRWNQVVDDNDIVWHLGDFAFGSSQYIKNILDQLKGNIHLILGNHDKPVRQHIHRFANADKLHKNHRFWNVQEIVVEDEEIDEGHKQHIVLSHFALRTWNRKHYGAFCAHGHSHGQLPWTPDTIAAVDVGVDCHDFYPVSYERLKEIITRRVMGNESSEVLDGRV